MSKEISAALLETRVRNVSVELTETESVDVDDVKGACLLELLGQSMRSPNGSTLWQLQKELSPAGISSRMVALAVASLLHDDLIAKHQLSDQDGDLYNSFALSDGGQRHLLRTYSSLMREEKQRSAIGRAAPKADANNHDDLDDDIPF